MTDAVIDASACAGWLLPDEATPAAEKLLEDVLKERLRLVLPSLWEYEMVNLLRTAVTRQRLDDHEAKKALHLLSEIPVEFVPPDREDRSAILEVSLAHNLSAYDAAYLSLADRRGIPLITADKALLSLRSRFAWIKSV